MCLLLVAFCFLKATATGVAIQSKCDLQPNSVHLLSNKSFEVYQLKDRKIRFIPPVNLLNNSKNRRPKWFTTTESQRIKRRYNRAVVTMDRQLDNEQLWYELGWLSYKSNTVTLRLGKEPVLQLQNESSKIQMDTNSSLSLCFNLTGAPFPNISLYHSSVRNGNESAINASRYKVNKTCLEFGPVWEEDAGIISIRATNCFNSDTYSFRLRVNGSKKPYGISTSISISTHATATTNVRLTSVTTTSRPSRIRPIASKRATLKASKPLMATEEIRQSTAHQTIRLEPVQATTAFATLYSAIPIKRLEDTTMTTAVVSDLIPTKDRTSNSHANSTVQGLPLWVYILITVAAFIFLSVIIIFLLIRIYCEKRKFNREKAEESNRDAPPPDPNEIVYSELHVAKVFPIPCDSTYVNQNDTLQLQETNQRNPYDQLRPFPVDETMVDNIDYADVPKIQDLKNHEAAMMSGHGNLHPAIYVQANGTQRTMSSQFLYDYPEKRVNEQNPQYVNHSCLSTLNRSQENASSPYSRLSHKPVKPSNARVAVSTTNHGLQNSSKFNTSHYSNCKRHDNDIQYTTVDTVVPAASQQSQRNTEQEKSGKKVDYVEISNDVIDHVDAPPSRSNAVKYASIKPRLSNPGDTDTN